MIDVLPDMLISRVDVPKSLSEILSSWVDDNGYNCVGIRDYLDCEIVILEIETHEKVCRAPLATRLMIIGDYVELDYYKPNRFYFSSPTFFEDLKADIERLFGVIRRLRSENQDCRN